MVLPFAKFLRSNLSTPDITKQFMKVEKLAHTSLEKAECLSHMHEKSVSGVHEGRIVLSKRDWFELYGLHKVATAGKCKEGPPPWWTHKPRWKWQAWKAQGDLSPMDAKAKFVTHMRGVPGFELPTEDSDEWLSTIFSCSAWFPCFDGQPGAPSGLASAQSRATPLPCLQPSPQRAAPLSGSSVLDSTSVARPSPSAVVSEILGGWVQLHVQGLEPYLKRLGVGWPQRQAALSFKPKQSWAMENGKLKMSMASPMGERHEYFPFEGAAEEKDLQGNVFLKSSVWKDGTLIATSRSKDGKMTDIVAKRWIDPHSRVLVQETTYDGVTYTRVFQRS